MFGLQMYFFPSQKRSCAYEALSNQWGPFLHLKLLRFGTEVPRCNWAVFLSDGFYRKGTSDLFHRFCAIFVTNNTALNDCVILGGGELFSCHRSVRLGMDATQTVMSTHWRARTR